MVSILEIKQQKHALIERYAHANNVTGLGQVATTLVSLALLWLAAIKCASISYWLVAAIILLMSLYILRGLVLMHECGHGSLFKSQWLNATFGFVFGVISGMPQYVWSQHHDFHHANNGNWEKYRGPLTTPSIGEYAAMTGAQQRLYQCTRHIAIAPLGGFIYLLFNPRFTWMKGSIELLLFVMRKKFVQPRVSLRAHAATFKTRYWQSSVQYWHMFWNNVVLLSIWLVMCLAIGPGLFFAIYFISVSLAGGAGIILFTVQHNFEHAYASDSARWDYDTSAIEGTSFLILPRWLNWFTANIGYHHIHHLSAKIPNYCLVACHNEFRHLFDGVTRVKLIRIPHALKCLLWDSNARRIISIAEYLQQRKPA